MGRRVARTSGALLLGLTMGAACAASVAAAPASGPHGTIDLRLTTTKPNRPMGTFFAGRYHAAGNPGADPPYMRKMVFYNRSGMVRDTSVPERCTAGDAELVAFGPAACPAGSRVGSGHTDIRFLGLFPNRVEVQVFNNAGEQIMLARGPALTTVARGRIRPDGSVEFASPTCYPHVEPPGCPADTVLQLGSVVTLPPYRRRIGGKLRSYLTSPRKCPRSGRWRSPVRFWWADGTVETITTYQRCTRARSARRGSRRSAPGLVGRQ